MNHSRSGGRPLDDGAVRPRASDAQRSRVLHAIDAALVDGRLDRLEHLERTRSVTRSTFVDELRPLVADLRGSHDDPGLGSPAPGEHVDPPPAGRPRTRRGVVVGVVIAAVTAVVVGGAVVAAVSGDGAGAGSPTVVVDEPGPLLTSDGIGRMLGAAREEFGDVPVDSLGLYDERAVLMYEDPAEPGKRLSHVFRGQWAEPTFSSRTDSATFRLSAVDPAIVAAGIEQAPGHLEMGEVTVGHVSVFADALGDPEYQVVLFGDDGAGRVTYDDDGEVRDVRQPG